MFRKLLGLVAVMVCAAVASAEPPSGARVLAAANVRPFGGGVFMTKQMVADGLILPVPGLGFLPVPVEVWRCEVWQTPANAPAGAPPVRNVVTLFTFGG